MDASHNQVECEVCGGTDFVKESGYYYCNECQTQTQEIQEHVFQEETEFVDAKKSRKIKKSADKSLDKNITSWECWNVIICSLTKELINLGADPRLKNAVKCLWIKYLEKLQVVNLSTNEVPKLQAVNALKDRNIIYGKRKKRRTRRQSGSDESNVTSSLASTSSRLRAKKKRALSMAHYEALSQKSTQDSIHNETLTSLKSSSDQTNSTKIRYNYYAARELTKQKSRNHYKAHESDSEMEMSCHSTYKTSTSKYRKSVYYLSPNKIYGLLYLGLLIIKDRIQLSDLIRFIREGYLSFNYFTHLFPDEYFDKFMNLASRKNQIFSNQTLRVVTAKLATFLRVESYVQIPNLVFLSERYCKELNLPDSFSDLVKIILSHSTPKLKLQRRAREVPNYEGRVLSIILFILKLLFGFDDATEFEYSKLAKILNDTIKNENPMFDVIGWIKHLIYRKLIIAQHHFPTKYSLNEKSVDSDMILEHFKARDVKNPEYFKLTKEMTDFRELLLKLEHKLPNLEPSINFVPTLTPFFDYSKIISTSIVKNNFYLTEYLNIDNSDNNLDFILNSYKYLELINSGDDVRSGGKNENIKFHELRDLPNEALQRNRHDNKLIDVLLIDESKKETLPDFSGDLNKTDQPIDKILANFDFDNKKKFQYIKKQLKRIDHDENCSINESILDKIEYGVHYNPFERYWLNLRMKMNWVGRKECVKFLNEYPQSFRIVFNDCVRICEQTETDLFHEFQLTELYLVYVAKYSSQDKKNDVEGRLLTFVKEAKKNW